MATPLDECNTLTIWADLRSNLMDDGWFGCGASRVYVGRGPGPLLLFCSQHNNDVEQQQHLLLLQTTQDNQHFSPPLPPNMQIFPSPKATLAAILELESRIRAPSEFTPCQLQQLLGTTMNGEWFGLQQ
jgi:hypothetical protein